MKILVLIVCRKFVFIALKSSSAHSNTFFCLQIDLQWLVIHCDPHLAAKETCDEIPPNNDNPDPEPCTDCPPGPPGAIGPMVSKYILYKCYERV